MAKVKAPKDIEKGKKSKGEPKVNETEANVEETNKAKAESEETANENSADKENAEAKENVTEEAASENAEAKENAGDDEELSAKYMRLAADFQNYRRRTEKEKSDIYAYASEKLVVQLLDVIDNFDRAIAQAEGNEQVESFAEGMKLISKQLMDVLDKNGVKEIETLGADFDPNFHNAVMMEDTDQFESGKCSAILQKGYTLNGKVIRPSMVKVAN